MKKIKDGIVIGLALFAMFFGAGNLIFPPQIGIESGRLWYLAALGFLMTGIGLPLLGIFASVKAGETLKKFQPKVGKHVIVIFQIVMALTLGLVAIPRTSATTHEMGVNMFLEGISPIVTAIVFFGITILLAIKPTGIIDRIGKILTPVLVLILGLIIYKGVTEPIGNPAVGFDGNTFGLGFFGGYQTMDALGALIFGGIILNTLKEKGYKSTKDQMKMTVIAGMVAALGLVLVYGGLMYLGSTAKGVIGEELSKTALTVTISSMLFGKIGTWMLGIGVSAACLTTSIGLVATISDFFSDLSKGKISYKFLVVSLSVISGMISVMGVDEIVNVAAPILVVVYPVAIVLIFFILADAYINQPLVYRLTLAVTFFISLLQGLYQGGIFVKVIGGILAFLPLYEVGFPWLLPTVLVFAVSLSLKKISNIGGKNSGSKRHGRNAVPVYYK